MKIKLNIELDLPNNYKNYTNGELIQLIFDEYINYVTVNHLSDALEWMTESLNKHRNNEYVKNAKLIAKMHSDFANISKQAKWELIKTK